MKSAPRLRKDPITINRNVCFVCLKRFSACDNVESVSKTFNVPAFGILETAILTRRKPADYILSENGDPIAPDSEVHHVESDTDLYKRLLILAGRYLNFVAAEKFISKWEERKRETGKVPGAFCSTCKDLIKTVCDLYSELQVIKLKLSWKLEMLGDAMKNGSKSVSVKLSHGLCRDLAQQLSMPAITQCKIFRNFLISKCIDKTKDAVPKTVIPKGLFPEFWIYTYAATQKMLMRFIVIFALASSSVVKDAGLAKEKDSINSSQFAATSSVGSLARRTEQQYRKRTRVKLEAQNNLISEAIVKKENPLEVDDLNPGTDLGTFKELHSENYGNDSDPNWSDGDMDVAPSPMAASKSDEVNERKEGMESFVRRSLRNRTITRKFYEDGSRSDSEDDTVNTRRIVRISKIQGTDASLKCPECDKVIGNRSGLGCHMRDIHKKGLEHPCKLCDEVLYSFKDYRLHRQKVHGCNRNGSIKKPRFTGGSSPRGFKGKKYKNVKNQDRSFADVPCKLCNKMCIGTNGLNMHLRIFHGKCREYSCSVCGLKFKLAAELKAHRKKVHPLRLIGTTNVSCHICGTKFKTRNSLLRHALDVHKNDSVKISALENVTQCPICFVSLARGQYQQHVTEEHQVNKSRGTGVFHCEVCARSFYQTEHKLRSHMMYDHNGKYSCFTCDADFVTGADLRDHLAKAHETEKKTFFCNFCFRGFSDKQYFDVHKKLVHMSTFERFFCDQDGCSKEYQSAEDLKEHLKEHFKSLSEPIINSCKGDKEVDRTFAENGVEVAESNNKAVIVKVENPDEVSNSNEIFSCKECGNSFLDVERLYLHELLHIPFNEEICGIPCPKCDYAPSKVARLIFHYNRLHGINMRPYKCTLCGDRSFQELSDFQEHQKFHISAAAKGTTEKQFCGTCGVECLDSVAVAWHTYRHRKEMEKDKKAAYNKMYKERKSLKHQLKSESRQQRKVRRPKKPKPPKPEVSLIPGTGTKRRVGRPRRHNPEGLPIKRRKMPETPEEKAEYEGKILEGQEVPDDAVECSVCHDKFKSERHVLRHLNKEHEKKGKRTLQCRFCYMSFVHQQTFVLHMKYRLFHSENNKFICDYETCHAEYESVQELNEHLKLHVEDATLQPKNTEGDKRNDGNITPTTTESTTIHYCKICNWGFLNPDILELHELVHTRITYDDQINSKVGVFLCKVCQKGCTSVISLTMHFNKEHGKYIPYHKCSLCGAKFHTKYRLVGHRLGFHEERERPDKTETGKKKKKKKKRKIDEDDENKVHKCETCGKEFSDSYALTCHTRNNHGKIFTCPEKDCGQNFVTKGRWYYHFRKFHSFPGDKEGKQICYICGTVLSNAACLTVHIRGVHNSPGFECDVCHKMFKRKGALKVHKTNVHDPDRAPSHQCSDCGKSFYTNTGLVYHIKTDHTKMEDRRFACSYCPKRYHRPLLLRMHEKTCRRINGGNPDNEPTKKMGWPKGKPRGKRKKKEDNDDEEEMEDKTTTEEEGSGDEEKPSTSSTTQGLATRSRKRTEKMSVENDSDVKMSNNVHPQFNPQNYHPANYETSLFTLAYQEGMPSTASIKGTNPHATIDQTFFPK